MANKDFFEELYQVNVNDYTEEKNGLTYLSWAYAVAEVCKRYNAEFDYQIERFGENHLPYVYDEGVGFMVFTNITLCGKTRMCWLPVMDEKNNAMLKVPYKYKVKKYEYNPNTRKKEWKGEYEEKTVEKATMFDVNKTIMRCLVKNLAMFGLGLYIYAGEDLPEELFVPATQEQIDEMKNLGVNIPNALRWAKVDTIEKLSFSKAQTIIESKKGSNNGNNAE